MPLDMVQELRQRLGQREFHIQPVVWRNGVYEALVKIELDNAGSGMPFPLLPLARSPFFEHAKSRAWQLRCCWDAVKWNVPLWLACFRSHEDNVILGETDLGKLLLDEIREAAQGNEQSVDEPPREGPHLLP